MRDGQEECRHPASEGLATLGADEGRGDEVGVMVAFEVHVQQLLLPEGLLTLAAGVRLLPGVRSPMHDHVALLDAAARETQLHKASVTQFFRSDWSAEAKAFRFAENIWDRCRRFIVR